MSMFDEPASCPVCNGQAARILSVPLLRQMAGSQVAARDRNERSAHEPKLVVREKGAPSDGTPAPRAAHARHAPRRPWVLGQG